MSFLFRSPGKDVDRGPGVDRETVSGGPPILQVRV
jgi:hypothetical protein